MAENVIFADGLLQASARHGVARLTMAAQDGEGKPVVSGTLVVPLPQLPALVATMTRLLREVEAKVREGAPQQQGMPPQPVPAEPPAGENTALPPAFRFQS